MKRWLVKINLLKLKDLLTQEDYLMFKNIIITINKVFDENGLCNEFNKKISSSVLIVKKVKKPNLTLLLRATWNKPSCYDILDGLLLFLQWLSKNNLTIEGHTAYIREPFHEILVKMMEEGTLMVC